QRDVGGWPTLKSKPAPVDTDSDGMPDVWEKARGLDPANAKDRNGNLDGDGYTNLETYLNSLVE
ncbi:MAG: pectate lyase, partial [Planctomycetales bacterium]